MKTKKNLRHRLKLWAKSAAGISSLLLMLASVILLILAFSSWGSLTDNDADLVNGLLIGLAATLIGIIVTISFVQFLLDKQDEKKEMSEENAVIARYDRFMAVLIGRYFMFYRCVTVPILKQSKINNDDPLDEFLFEDMSDLYETSLYLSEDFTESSITLFYRAEEKLRDYMLSMIENVQFKYNEELEIIIMKFIEKSLSYDMRGAILGISHDKDMVKRIQQWIKDDSKYNWTERMQVKDKNSNIMLLYVKLYELLKIEIELLKLYIDYVDKKIKH